MSRVDLHLHSTVSDGLFSPEEVVKKAVQAGLTVMALTDHDTVDGIAPALKAARAFPRLTMIPGVEISTYVTEGEVHVLGYFLDYTHPELLARLSKMRVSRLERAQGMIARLKDLGLPIEWERVRQIAGGSSIGRPHLAQAMLEKGYISSMKEAFTRYIGWGGPAYVRREKITPVEVVALILQTGGLPVLAHPLTIQGTEKMIADLKTSGLVGIEAYYKDYTGEEISRLVDLAGRYGLIATGGSDYHGFDDGSEIMMGGVNVPLSAAEELSALAGARTLKPSASLPKEGLT